MSLASIRWDLILGGFGLFMFGIEFLGSGLKSVAGDQMRDFIDKYTSNPISAMVIGIALTILMQSSSASTAITIGFVRAGLMSLEQAAGIVMGANIGTTITSLLISLNIDRICMYIVFIGCMMICFTKKRRWQYYGQVCLGFGLLFFGLCSMGDALSAIKDLPEFSDFAVKMSNNSWLSLLVGTGMTAVVQSSAATIGVVQKLYDAGALTLEASLPFMFGADIGTTATGLLASIGGSIGGRRTAVLHTTFNVIAALIGMLILPQYTSFVAYIGERFSLNPMMQIAIANMIFKTAATLLFLPFLKYLVAFVKKIVPGEEPVRPSIDIDNLDSSVATLLPAAAVDEAHKAIIKMAGLVRTDIKDTQAYLNKPGTHEDREILAQNESLINNCDKRITKFLIDTSISTSIPPQEKEKIRVDLETVKNLERIGDLAVNLAEFFDMVFEEDGTFTSVAQQEINSMFDTLEQMYDWCIQIYDKRDITAPYDTLMELEEKLDRMEVIYRNAHFTRMEKGECNNAVAASTYSDILGTLERMGDHCVNVAKSILSMVDDYTLETNREKRENA